VASFLYDYGDSNQHRALIDGISLLPTLQQQSRLEKVQSKKPTFNQDGGLCPLEVMVNEAKRKTQQTGEYVNILLRPKIVVRFG
jgi:hypothetical protein